MYKEVQSKIIKINIFDKAGSEYLYFYLEFCMIFRYFIFIFSDIFIGSVKNSVKKNLIRR